MKPYPRFPSDCYISHIRQAKKTGMTFLTVIKKNWIRQIFLLVSVSVTHIMTISIRTCEFMPKNKISYGI